MLRRLVAFSVLALAFESVALAKPCPNIMLVLDQSGSMAQDTAGKEVGDPQFTGLSKWSLLKQVVTDIVKQYGDFVPFGLSLYSGSRGGNDAGCWAHSVNTTIPVAHDSGGEILAALAKANPDAETATNGAIHNARMDPGLADTKKPNFIVLVTDGNPNCGTDQSSADIMTHVIPNMPGTTLDELEQAAAQKPPIRTYVIGFDGTDGVNKENLDNMAYYGKTARFQGCTSANDKPCYYSAGVNFADFKKAFDDIVNDAGGGEFGGSQCDDSCYSNACPAGQICTTSEVNQVPHCEPDQCMGAKCEGDTFCRSGKCVKACDHHCDTGTKCVDGACVEDKCFNKSCMGTQVCNPKDGVCIDSPCPKCNDRGSYCDVATGKCLTDGCKTLTITCPSADYTCVNKNNCESNSSSGSCALAGVGSSRFDPRNTIAGTLLLLAVSMLLRRRSRPQ